MVEVDGITPPGVGAWANNIIAVGIGQPVAFGVKLKVIQGDRFVGTAQVFKTCAFNDGIRVMHHHEVAALVGRN